MRKKSLRLSCCCLLILTSDLLPAADSRFPNSLRCWGGGRWHDAVLRFQNKSKWVKYFKIKKKFYWRYNFGWDKCACLQYWKGHVPPRFLRLWFRLSAVQQFTLGDTVYRLYHIILYFFIAFYIFKLNLPSNWSCHLSVAALKYVPLNCRGEAENGNTWVEVLQICTVRVQHCEQMNKSQLENIMSVIIYITKCLKTVKIF